MNVKDEYFQAMENRDATTKTCDEMGENRQVLNIDESIYAGDEEMNYILNRLHAAVSDAKVRREMDMEDKYFQAIENRNLAILKLDKKIKELDHQIAEQRNALFESAKMLKNAGFNVAQIALATKLPTEEIQRL